MDVDDRTLSTNCWNLTTEFAEQIYPVQVIRLESSLDLQSTHNRVHGAIQTLNAHMEQSQLQVNRTPPEITSASRGRKSSTDLGMYLARYPQVTWSEYNINLGSTPCRLCLYPWYILGNGFHNFSERSHNFMHLTNLKPLFKSTGITLRRGTMHVITGEHC